MEESAAAPVTEPAPVETAPAPEAAPVATEAPIADILGSIDDNAGILPDTSNDPWVNQLSEEYRNDPNVLKYGSMDEMAKGLINQSALIGRKGIIKPGENATPEEMGEYFNQLGRPTESSMYKYEPIEGAPEVDQEQMEGFQNWAHEKGLSQDHYQDLIEFDLQRQQGAQAQFEQERVEEASNTRLNIYDEMGEIEGNAFMADAKQAAHALGLTNVLKEEGMINNEQVVRALAKAGKSLGSSSLIGEHGSGVMNFEEQEAAIRNNPAFRDKTHPEYNDLEAKMNDLYKRRYPNQ